MMYSALLTVAGGCTTLLSPSPRPFTKSMVEGRQPWLPTHLNAFQAVLEKPRHTLPWRSHCIMRISLVLSITSSGLLEGGEGIGTFQLTWVGICFSRDVSKAQRRCVSLCVNTADGDGLFTFDVIFFFFSVGAVLPNCVVFNEVK